MKSFFLCFVPLFVAVDAVGVLPLFLGFTEGLAPNTVRRTIRQSVITAAAVALAFTIGGSWLLEVMGITVADFMVAGGILLTGLSLRDILTAQHKARALDDDTFGAVPLGVPLIAGPAVLTTSLLLAHEFGMIATSLAIIANIILAGLVFMAAPAINRVIGKAGARALSKISGLLLAAIAVMIMRKGIVEIVKMSLTQ